MSSKSLLAVQVVLAARGEHELDRSRVRGFDRGADALGREPGVVDLVVAAGEVLARPADEAGLDRERDRLGDARRARRAKQFSRSALTGQVDAPHRSRASDRAPRRG